MICNNCGKANESDSNFCKYCGTSLNPTDPQHTIFENPYPSQSKSTIDLGYLLLAILILINVFIWFFWNVLFGGADISNNRILFKVVRISSTILSLAQFAVMFIFAKRLAYKIVIGIIAGIIILYDLYLLMITLTDSRF